MSQSRPKKPPIPPDHGKVAEGAARALRQQVEPTPGNFAEGVEAHRTYKRMCPETEAGCDLGPFIPREGQADAPIELGGPTHVIRFPEFLSRWFAKQSPGSLAALDTLSRRQMRRAFLREIFAENWKRMLAVGGGVYAAFQWGVEALVWFGEKLPALKGLWQALQHGPPT